MHILTTIIFGFGIPVWFQFPTTICGIGLSGKYLSSPNTRLQKSALLSVPGLNTPDVTTDIYLQSPHNPTPGNRLHLREEGTWWQSKVTLGFLLLVKAPRQCSDFDRCELLRFHSLNVCCRLLVPHNSLHFHPKPEFMLHYGTSGLGFLLTFATFSLYDFS